MCRLENIDSIVEIGHCSRGDSHGPFIIWFKYCNFSLLSAEPINTFHGAYKTDNEPIRLSYHRNVHYNSVVDPYKATIGVGLGLPGFQPGVCCISQLLFID